QACLTRVSRRLLAGKRCSARRQGLAEEHTEVPRRSEGDAGPGRGPRDRPPRPHSPRRRTDHPARGAAGGRPQRLPPRANGHGPAAAGSVGKLKAVESGKWKVKGPPPFHLPLTT